MKGRLVGDVMKVANFGVRRGFNEYFIDFGALPLIYGFYCGGLPIAETRILTLTLAEAWI